jgi:alpha-beta hydrolase superfamily lysophospholipase
MIRTLVRALGLLALLAGCAPTVQLAARPGVLFTGPVLRAHDFVSFDGAVLATQTWAPASGEPWAVIVGVHGMDDYANAFDIAGPAWAADGITTIAYDQRGFGRAPGRGVWAGQGLMTRDLDTLVRLTRARYPHAVIAVVGESMGAAVAIAVFAAPDPPPADRLVLVSPAVWGWSSQPVAYRAALWLTAHVDGPVVLRPPSFLAKHIQVTDNIDELRRMGRDPLMIWGARTDTLYGLVNLMQTASREIGAPRAPTLVLGGAHDQIIPPAALRAAARGLRPDQRSAYYAHGWHLLLVDHQAPVVFGDIEGFIRDPAAPLGSGAPPIPGAPVSVAAVAEAAR